MPSHSSSRAAGQGPALRAGRRGGAGPGRNRALRASAALVALLALAPGARAADAPDTGAAPQPGSPAPDTGGAPEPGSSAPDAGGAPEPGSPAPNAGGAPEPQPVGQPSAEPRHSPEIAHASEQPGVLTPRGTFVLEPSVQYTYSSSNRVTLLGYTIIPAITIGLINVQDVKSRSAIGFLTGRYGLTNRWEIEARVPYVYRSESTVALPLNTGSSTATPITQGARGIGLGDVEAATRYQLVSGGPEGPYVVGSLRFKSRTGRDPFQVETIQQLSGFNGASLHKVLPTGSGFYSLQPSVSVLIPSDPVVVFAGASYVYSFARREVYQNTDAGRVALGTVRPGGVITVNVGMGISLNARSSLSLGYEHDSIDRTTASLVQTIGTRVELGTALLGLSYRRTQASTISFALGIGVTRDTPDVTLTLRAPIAF